MQELRRALRWIVSGCTGLLTLAFAPVVTEFLIELAREKGLYARPSERLDALMATASAFVTQTWFVALTTFFIGLTLGLWADAFMRRREKAESEPPPIEIRFDPSNPGGRFWSRHPVFHDGQEYYGFQCRVAVRNTTTDILKDVSAIMDGGDVAPLPTPLTFVGEGKRMIDINPGASEMLQVLLYVPAEEGTHKKTQDSMLTVYTKGAPLISRRVWIDSSRKPAFGLYD